LCAPVSAIGPMRVGRTIGEGSNCTDSAAEAVAIAAVVAQVMPSQINRLTSHPAVGYFDDSVTQRVFRRLVAIRRIAKYDSGDPGEPPDRAATVTHGQEFQCGRMRVSLKSS